MFREKIWSSFEENPKLVRRKSETRSKKRCERPVKRRKLENGRESTTIEDVVYTSYQRKVFKVIEIETRNDHESALFGLVAFHFGKPVQEFKADYNEFSSKQLMEFENDLWILGPDIDIFVKMLHMGISLNLFANSGFVKSFKGKGEPYGKSKGAVHLNCLTHGRYQLFQWQKHLLCPQDENLCQQLTDHGEMPSEDKLRQFFEEHQVMIAMEHCKSIHAENLKLIAESERERNSCCICVCAPLDKCMLLSSCNHPICKECLANWVESCWNNLQNRGGGLHSDKIPNAWCKCITCSCKINDSDIKRAHPKIASEVELRRLFSKHRTLSNQFSIKEELCTRGHANSYECLPTTDWEQHAPGGLMIVRRFIWTNMNKDPKEFEVLENIQKCTSNSVIGPKSYSCVKGSFGLINSVKKCDIIGGSPFNLGSGGQMAKNQMTHRQVLKNCNIRVVHKNHQHLLQGTTFLQRVLGMFPTNLPLKRNLEDRLYGPVKVAENNADLVKMVYDDWGHHRYNRSLKKHNEVLVNLDHTMVCGLWGHYKMLPLLKELQLRFFKRFGRKVRVYIMKGNGPWTHVPDKDLESIKLLTPFEKMSVEQPVRHRRKRKMHHSKLRLKYQRFSSTSHSYPSILVPYPQPLIPPIVIPQAPPLPSALSHHPPSQPPLLNPQPITSLNQAYNFTNANQPLDITKLPTISLLPSTYNQPGFVGMDMRRPTEKIEFLSSPREIELAYTNSTTISTISNPASFTNRRPPQLTIPSVRIPTIPDSFFSLLEDVNSKKSSTSN